MRSKIITGVLIGVLPIVMGGNAMALSASVSPSATSVAVGDGFTVTVQMSGAAAWNVHLSASGPVDGCTIAEADATNDAKNTSRSFIANCQATGEGTIALSLGGDVTDEEFNTEYLSGGASVVAYIPEPEPGKPEPEPSEPSRPSEPSGQEAPTEDAPVGEEWTEEKQDAVESGSTVNDSKNADNKTTADKKTETKTSTKTTTGTKKNNTVASDATNEDNSQESEDGGVPVLAIAIVSVLAIAGVGVGIFFLVRHFKKPTL